MLRDVRYEAGLAGADALRKRGDLAQAEKQLAALTRNGTPDDRAARMLEQIRAQQLAVAEKRERDVARIAGSVQERLKRDEVAAAESALATARAEYPNEKTWSTLQTDIGKRKAFLDALKRAEQERKRGRYSEAHRILATLNSTEPADQARVLALSEAVTSDENRKIRIEALENAKRQLQKLKREGDSAALVALLKETRQQFPEETAFRYEYEQAVAEAGRNTALQAPADGPIVETRLEPDAGAARASSKFRWIGAIAGLLVGVAAFGIR